MELYGLQLPGGLIYELGALMLLVGLAWAAYRYHTRNRRNDRLTDAAVHEVHNAQRSEALRRKAEPS